MIFCCLFFIIFPLAYFLLSYLPNENCLFCFSLHSKWSLKKKLFTLCVCVILVKTPKICAPFNENGHFVNGIFVKIPCCLWGSNTEVCADYCTCTFPGIVALSSLPKYVSCEVETHIEIEKWGPRATTKKRTNTEKNQTANNSPDVQLKLIRLPVFFLHVFHCESCLISFLLRWNDRLTHKCIWEVVSFELIQNNQLHQQTKSIIYSWWISCGYNI